MLHHVCKTVQIFLFQFNAIGTQSLSSRPASFSLEFERRLAAGVCGVGPSFCSEVQRLSEATTNWPHASANGDSRRPAGP